MQRAQPARGVAATWVTEAQNPGVEGQTRRRRRVPVDRVAQNGVAELLHLEPDLVGAPRAERDAQAAGTGAPIYRFKVQHCLLCTLAR